MEYVQMTLDDWVQMKQKLKQELLGVKQSFVRIGYALRQIDDQKLYEQDGYKSIAEFAQVEYGLWPSTTSRFMSINREYSIDGYSEQLRPEYAELGRSQLEEMLKLPDTDRQMIQPETSREDIRELKRFNKTEPAAGVADDISQLVEKFYQDNELILNAVYGEEFDEQTINRFIEIVNPAGNRSYKKGLYFMMMYENRVTFKKFGDTPKDMTWWEFYQLTREIFDDTAAGPKTWQNHFGGADDEETTVQDTADEPGREETATEAPEPEDDGGAVGETGADDVQEIEKGGMEDHGAADEAGTGQEEDDTDGEESGQADCEEPAERTDEQTGAQSQREEIAPAQKSTETLEKEEVEDDETTVQDTADEPGREETATEAPEPEDDGGAVGETGADDVQEIEKGGMEDHGAADEAGTGQEEDDTDGEESGQADCEEPAERTDEQTGAQSQREEIAPAQKSTETLEKEEVEDDETGENESSDAENQTAESEPETAEREQTEETEVIEAVYGTRKEYMDRLSEQGMAEYMADEYKSHRLLVTDLANTWNLRKWLSEKVDRFGKPMEDAR